MLFERAKLDKEFGRILQAWICTNKVDWSVELRTSATVFLVYRSRNLVSAFGSRVWYDDNRDFRHYIRKL